MKTHKFIQVIPRFGAGHPNGGYTRGKDAAGAKVKHPPVLTMYATEAGVELTQSELDQITLRGCVYNPDVIIPVDQLPELNRQPSLIGAMVVELEVAEEKAPPTPSVNGGGQNGKPLEKWNKADLQAKCKELEIVFEETATNAQLIELIKGKQTE